MKAFRFLQEVDDLQQFFFDFVHAGDVLETNARPLLQEQFEFGLTE